MRRHLIENHKSFYESELGQQEAYVPIEKKKKFDISLNENEVKEACVQLVTTEKMPFSILDSQPFKTLTGQIFTGLGISPITSKNVMQHVAQKYDIVKAKIKKELKGRVISLKIDTASRHNRGMLGVNAQFYENKEICIRTLAIIELTKKHTGANLSSQIEAVLADFEVSKNQVYTVTSDNGRNMIKAINLLNEDLEEEEFAETQDYDVNIFNIESIKCAAHTLQLAVKDFFKNTTFNKVIERARNLSKVLRTSNFR